MIIKAVKYLFKFCKSFDISPIDSGGLSKSLLYLVWGLNLTAFAGSDLVKDNQYQPPSDRNGSIIYTVEKKVTAKDLYTESIELVNSTFFVVISSYDYEVPQFDVLIIPTGRAPPSFI
jgi:hypothetical protein